MGALVQVLEKGCASFFMADVSYLPQPAEDGRQRLVLRWEAAAPAFSGGKPDAARPLLVVTEAAGSPPADVRALWESTPHAWCWVMGAKGCLQSPGDRALPLGMARRGTLLLGDTPAHSCLQAGMDRVGMRQETCDLLFSEMALLRAAVRERAERMIADQQGFAPPSLVALSLGVLLTQRAWMEAVRGGGKTLTHNERAFLRPWASLPGRISDGWPIRGLEALLLQEQQRLEQLGYQPKMDVQGNLWVHASEHGVLQQVAGPVEHVPGVQTALRRLVPEHQPQAA